MNALIRITFLALLMSAGGSYGQSNLPACPSSGYFHNCFGTYTFANGNEYVGEFKDDKYNGQGTFTHLAENQWKGSKDDKRYPQQLITLAYGNKYVGAFKDGKYNGQGIYTHANGTKYVGEYKDGKPNGQGTWTFGGDIYVGGFKDDKWHGQGTYTLADGTKYVGEYKDDQRHGQGIFTYPDGTKHVGEWKDDKLNGQGAEYASNGPITKQGIWADGRFVRSVPVQQANVPDPEIARLRAEAEEAKRKQAEAELRLAQQQASQTTQTSPVTTQSATPIGKRVALVVGNSTYKIRPLKNSRNDADDMSRTLRSSGFEVIDIRDASLQQMRTVIRQFGDRLINNDVGLVYYSGHGIEIKGKNYFIPVNADIQREDEVADQSLDVSSILEKMSTAGKGVNILIVDACRDDPFGRSFRSSSRGLANMDAPVGTIIAFSTSPGKVASDGDARERNSPYTKHLLKAMQLPNKPIEQVFKEVRRAVQTETNNQQTPWENTSLSGDFYFKVAR